MRLGIFAKTFTRPTVEGVFDAIVEHDLNVVHFNFACAGLPSMPSEIPAGLAERIGGAAQRRCLEVAAVSGTFNIIHPNGKRREEGFQSLAVIAGHCRALKTQVITLCTGTRNAEDMWSPHPENESSEAWKEMLQGMENALELAEAHDLTLGVEPELANVVNSAAKARRLLDELQSSRVKIIMDGANLLHAPQIPNARTIWEEAFDLLGSQIVMAHGKDLALSGKFCAAGKGDLDWDLYLSLLQKVSFNGPLILHGLAEEEVEASVGRLQAKLVPTASMAARGLA